MNLFDCLRGAAYTEYLGLALRLNLFDHMSDKHGVSSKDLAKQIGRPPQIVEALLQVFRGLELVKLDPSGNFLVETGWQPFLKPGSRDYIGHAFELQQNSDLPQFRKAIDKFINQKSSEDLDPKVRPLSKLEEFRFSRMPIHDGEFLSSGAFQAGEELAALRDFSSYNSVIDLGGNDGAFLIPILKANPNLNGIVADLPKLKARAMVRANAANLMNRFEFAEINFFKGPLPKAPIYLCGYVLHDWPKHVAFYILSKIFAALPENGELILHESLLDDPDSSKRVVHWGHHLQFLLRNGGGGTLRSSNEYSQWLTDVGFRVTGVRFGKVKSFIFAQKN
jgi:hypothetical protein